MKDNIFQIFKVVYKKVIANQKDEVNFWILMFFIFTFTLSRITIYYLPSLYIHVRHVHIHHFAYGILILAVVGLLALNDLHRKKIRTMGAFYGIGLALAMDEFGMWIRLDDNYWLRHSYDAIFVTTAILILLVYFENFWRKIFHIIFRIPPSNQVENEIKDEMSSKKDM